MRPGRLGRPRPGHPRDVVISPGAVKEDDQQDPYISLRQALRALVLITNATQGTGWGDSSGSESAPDLARKLKGYSQNLSNTGEDFIHPKASSALMHRLASALLR